MHGLRRGTRGWGGTAGGDGGCGAAVGLYSQCEKKGKKEQLFELIVQRCLRSVG